MPNPNPNPNPNLLRVEDDATLVRVVYAHVPVAFVLAVASEDCQTRQTRVGALAQGESAGVGSITTCGRWQHVPGRECGRWQHHMPGRANGETDEPAAGAHAPTEAAMRSRLPLASAMQ